MLRVRYSFHAIVKIAALAILGCSAAQCANDTVIPLTVCEVVSNISVHEGAIVAIIGRYSFRSTGRWMGEEKCSAASAASPSPTPELWMVEDFKEGPKPPEHLNLDRAALKDKFALVQKRSILKNLRFGASDYDRWAVVYGRVEPRAADAAGPDDAHKAAANLVFRGSSSIIIITPGEW